MNARPVSLFCQQGISYVEVLVAIVLVAITLVPALEALQSGIKGADIHEDYVVDHYRLVSKFEEVLAKPFGTLLNESALAGSYTTETAYSDTAGAVKRRIVYLSYYDANNSDGDGDPFTISDADSDGDNNPYTGTDVDIGLLWVSAEIEGTVHTMETLVSR